MRLFWKLFCSIVALTALACSAGGHLLIDAQFRTSLDREVASLYDENQLVAESMVRALQQEPAPRCQTAALLADRMAAASGTSFRVISSSGAPLGGAAGPSSCAALPQALGTTQRGWVLTREPEGYCLRSARALELQDGTVYLESWRDMDDLFSARQAQYRFFFFLLLGLIAGVGGISLAVSLWITRPVARLSAAARQVAQGQLDVRVLDTDSGELGRLCGDFNHMADRLEAQVQDLQDAARRQEDFLHSFAHETKTPLTSIIGYADLLRSRPAAPEAVRERADYIFREGQRLEALSQKLSSLLVLDRTPPPAQRLPMAPLLHRTAGVMTPALTEAGLRLRLEIQDGFASGDPDLLETVVLNLLDNARKATAPGGELTLEGAPVPDGYEILVSDSGCGIPPEDLPRVTEPFYMVDKSRARAQGGAGLGLALCRRITESYGGTLALESTPGRGTRVRVRLKGGAS